MAVVPLEDILATLKIGEDGDWEFKDGKGGIGKSWAQTVSAFANTQGGTIVCGIESQDGDKTHILRGLKDAKEYRDKVWNALHSRDVISATCCANGDVQTRKIGSVEVVVVRVPPAPRQQRPVHVGKSPFGGNTYMRHDSGDYACSDAEVSQMVRDAADAPQDATILVSTSMGDIDVPTLKAYRNRLSARNPADRLLGLDDPSFLTALGAYQKQADPKIEGLTLAGILMFGTAEAIRSTAPGLNLTYLERSSANERHDHRISGDDSDWAPNLLNFFLAVYPALVSGLKTPFALTADAMRTENTPFHDALREALANTVIHADYRSRGSIRITKRPDAFVFENPGRSLTPILRIKEARSEIKSLTDIRNPSIARMFAKIGFAEKEGYGYPTIYRAWEDGKRHAPIIEEDVERNIVIVTLPLLSQISPEIEAALQRAIGSEYSTLSALDKDILVYAKQFGEVTTEAIRSIRKEHATEISGRLRVMAGKACGWLKKIDETKRAPTYVLASGAPLVWGEGRFGENTWGQPQLPLPQTLPHKGGRSDTIEDIIERIRAARQASRSDYEAFVLMACADDFRTSKELAAMLGRSSYTKLHERYVAPLVRQGLLELKFPETPRRSGQAYKTK